MSKTTLDRSAFRTMQEFMENTAHLAPNGPELQAQREATVLARQLKREFGQAKALLRQMSSYKQAIERLTPQMSEHAAQVVTSEVQSVMEQLDAALVMFKPEGGEA